MTTKLSGVIVGGLPEPKRSTATDSTCTSTSSRNSRIPTDAIVSNLRWP